MKSLARHTLFVHKTTFISWTSIPSARTTPVHRIYPCHNTLQHPQHPVHMIYPVHNTHNNQYTATYPNTSPIPTQQHTTVHTQQHTLLPKNKLEEGEVDMVVEEEVGVGLGKNSNLKIYTARTCHDLYHCDHKLHFAPPPSPHSCL